MRKYKEKKMKNKIIICAVIFCILATASAVFIACDNSGGLDSQSGTDKYGRKFGSYYDIDEYESGIYSIEYEIGDAGAMGKTMIGNYCYQDVKIAVSEDSITLTFYCKDKTFSDVKLDGNAGVSVEESDMYGYKFDIDREDLNEKFSMTGYVSMMKKDVAFSIKVDLSKARLIG